MKNKILIFAIIVLASLTTFASTNTSAYNRYYNDYGNSFTFVERGITFSVFQNGEFDFYINQFNDINIGYRNNNVNVSYNSGYNYDTYVQYDTYGAIIQIENTPIYYDYYGRVDRIGNINLNYQYGKLARLGGLYVHYNSYGSYSYCSGYINTYNRNYVYHPYHNYFSRPLFEYRIVSYKPYRNYYKPNRYTYYKDHSRNNYNSIYNKRSNHNTKQRIATQNVPKRSNDRITSTERNSNRSSYNSNRTNGTHNKTIRNSTKRNTTGINSDRNSVAIKRSPRKLVQQKRNVTENRPARIQEKRSSVINSKRPKISQNRYKTVSTRKPITKATKRKSTVTTRKSESRKIIRAETTRKRRS
ncbi:MAG: hypothetical protein COC22_05545 [Flavobacteriaceae bacterium]|nr:MAG: hypothetical protein COC22_05545 [Flavobacteriaceae bacterium]